MISNALTTFIYNDIKCIYILNDIAINRVRKFDIYNDLILFCGYSKTLHSLLMLIILMCFKVQITTFIT